MRRVEEQVSELQNSLKFVMDSVQQTLTAVNAQQVVKFKSGKEKRFAKKRVKHSHVHW